MATIAAMGASGNIGSKITDLLLAGGHGVRVLGRSAERLAGARARGAEVLTGDAADVAFLARAFAGADAAFTLQPSNPTAADLLADQDRDGEAIAAAAASTGLRYLVAISSVGADVPSGTGPIAGLHRQEARLQRLAGANVLVLRPGFFFENFLSVLGLIKGQGLNGSAVAGETTVPMIDTRDIAAVAAAALAARDWAGFLVKELLGPRDYSFNEATRIIGAAIGKPDLPYVQFPYADYAAALQQAGLSKSAAELYAEMEKALNEGRAVSREGRTPANTTPTTFEQFARDVIAPAYAAA